MSSAFEEFGIGDGDEALGSKAKKFAGKDNEKYRVSFVMWPGIEEGKPNLDAATPRFLGCKRLYIQGVGYVLDKGPEFVKLAGEKSRTQIATLIVKWPTDTEGVLDKARFQEGKWSVMPWIFSQERYGNIKTTHSEFPLGSHDVILHCTDAQYQKISVSPCRESLFRKLLEKDPAKVQGILESAKELIASLPGEMAQDLSLEQIREKLAGGRGGGGGGGNGGGGGSRPAAAQGTKEFDSMLDDILS